MKFFEEQARECKERLKEQQRKEIELVKAKEKLKEEKQLVGLEMAKKLSQARSKMSEQLARQFEEKYQLIIAEKEKEIKEVKAQVDELKRKTEQKPQQFQGEVLEEFLEKALKQEVPFDEVEPVKTGQRGADLIQVVRTFQETVCGKNLVGSQEN